LSETQDRIAALQSIPCPRRVQFRSAKTRRYALLAIVGMALLPHNLIGWGLMGAALNEIALVAIGTDVDGRVVERKQTTSKGKTFHYVRLSYQCGGHSHLTSEKAVDLKRWGDLTEGTPVRVRCAESFGGTGADLLDEQGHLEPGWAGIILGAIFWNAMLFVFWYTLVLHHAIAAWLVRSGVPVSGRMVRFDAKSDRSSSGTLRYEYRLPDGHARRGWALLASRADAQRFSMGDELVVLHHPRWPFISCAAAFAPVEVVPPTA
jgi:hypothetical protein